MNINLEVHESDALMKMMELALRFIFPALTVWLTWSRATDTLAEVHKMRESMVALKKKIGENKAFFDE
jgi:hypothetical protein